MKDTKIPSAQNLIEEALRKNPNHDVNSLHVATYQLMIKYRSKYYSKKVDEFLSPLHLPQYIQKKLKNKLLEPIRVGDKEYSNFMEEASRRISQSFQPISGKLAEICAEKELEKNGLTKDINFTLRKKRTDITVYYPNVHRFKIKHRIEVKNVSLRERATRGLSFDGDSLFGFFNQPSEFTKSNVEELDRLCKETNGYYYVPPGLLRVLLRVLGYRGTRMRSNLSFGSEMAIFANTGKLP